jgi:hypothetical protein
MSKGKKPGFLHFLQRLFGLGGDKLKPAPPAPPAKKNRPSHAPKRKLPGKGSANKEPSSDKLAKKEPPSGDKPAKKVAAKPKPGTKPKAPPPAAPAEAPGEVPPHARPAADRQQERSEEKAAPSVYTPATPEKPERKRSRHRRQLALQWLQVRRRPRTCVRQSARQESQTPKKRSPAP